MQNSNLIIHPRIHEGHPEISDRDVKDAWNNVLLSAPRRKVIPFRWIAIGMDSKGRLLEMVARRNDNGLWLIYHALTPPTKKFYQELGVGRQS
jgi:hypothetical protein